MLVEQLPLSGWHACYVDRRSAEPRGERPRRSVTKNARVPLIGIRTRSICSASVAKSRGATQASDGARAAEGMSSTSWWVKVSRRALRTPPLGKAVQQHRDQNRAGTSPIDKTRMVREPAYVSGVSPALKATVEFG